MLDSFKQHVRSRGLTVDEDVFSADLDFIRAMIHLEIDIAVFNLDEARRNLFDEDPQAQYGMTLFEEAERFLQLENQPSLVAQQ